MLYNFKCSKHMNEDKSLFSSFTPKNWGFVYYGDNNKGRITCSSIIGKYYNSMIGDVLSSEGLKHALLSISSLCDKDNNVTFDLFASKVIKFKNNQTYF